MQYNIEWEYRYVLLATITRGNSTDTVAWEPYQVEASCSGAKKNQSRHSHCSSQTQS